MEGGRSSSSRQTFEGPIDDRKSASMLTNFIINGSKKEILKMDISPSKVFDLINRDSILHIAASAGQAELIHDMLHEWRYIIAMRNAKGDSVFHTAANAGSLETLRALILAVKGTNMIHLLGSKNNEGNTPLHIALQNNDEDMASTLVDEYWQACYQLNEKNVSPLCLAIDAGHSWLVLRMISFMTQSGSRYELLKGKSVVHAALQANNIEVLAKLLGYQENLIELVDEEGKTPLSYAASIGYVEGVEHLLSKFPDYAFVRDQDNKGSLPIHTAAKGGHKNVLIILHSMQLLLNYKGQNILHLAARSGKSEVVSYILNVRELEGLLNKKDEDGNTPLHLAVKWFHPRVTYILTRDKRIDLGLLNKDGVTARDLAEIFGGLHPNFEMRLTRTALRCVNAPRSSQTSGKSYLRQVEDRVDSSRKEKPIRYKESMESYNGRIQTFILVATLVATVTFAAGFTPPGGYNQSEPGIGMATLANRPTFQVFVICNTAAMYASILAVVIFIWSQLGELDLLMVSLKYGLLVLGFAIASMSIAFMMALFVVLRSLPWLSYVVLGMGCFFLTLVLVVFFPIYNPSYIKNGVHRFFFTISFRVQLSVGI